MISPIAWAVTIAVVLTLCAGEVLLALRRPAALGFRAATMWSLLYIALAVLFGVVLGMAGGWELGSEYFAGFVVEKSLSIDNLFVFVIIIGSFAVPDQYRSRALTWGILAAFVLRCAFIAVGAALIASFSVTFVVFGGILVFTAAQLIRHRGSEPSAHGQGISRMLGRFIPISTEFETGRLLVRRDGRLLAAPMLVVLVVMAVTDGLFALDSIPAVFGVTDHPFVVFAANAFALLGMRPLYFLVSGLVARVAYLSEGIAAILAFIGVKLILEYVHEHAHGAPQIGTAASLAVIVGILAVSAVASWLSRHRESHRECRTPADVGMRGRGVRGDDGAKIRS